MCKQNKKFLIYKLYKVFLTNIWTIDIKFNYQLSIHTFLWLLQHFTSDPQLISGHVPLTTWELSVTRFVNKVQSFTVNVWDLFD